MPHPAVKNSEILSQGRQRGPSQLVPGPCSLQDPGFPVPTYLLSSRPVTEAEITSLNR